HTVYFILSLHDALPICRGASGEEDGYFERSFFWKFLRMDGRGEQAKQEQKGFHARISLTSTLRPSFAERIPARSTASDAVPRSRSEEHTSELQSPDHIV